MADQPWYWAIEKIAGTGLARQHNLARCRKELLQSRINHKQRSNYTSPPTKTSPEDLERVHVADNLDQYFPPLNIREYKNVTEWAHNPHNASPPTFGYSEQDIRQRARVIRYESARKSKARRLEHGMLEAPPNTDPFHNRTANNFSTDFCVEEKRPSTAASKNPSTSSNTPQPSDEDLRLKELATRIGDACKVRDEELYHRTLSSEELHQLRMKAWERHLGLDSPLSSPDNVESVTVTEDGCIFQRGYRVSPYQSKADVSLPHTARRDSLQPFDKDSKSKKTKSSKNYHKSDRGHVRNQKGFKVPLYFRKREVPQQRRCSILSSTLTSRRESESPVKNEKYARSKVQQTSASEGSLPQPPRRPVVFFTGSVISDVISSDSEEGNDQRDTAATSLSLSKDKDKGGSGISVRIPSAEVPAKRPLEQAPAYVATNRTESAVKTVPTRRENPPEGEVAAHPQASQQGSLISKHLQSKNELETSARQQSQDNTDYPQPAEPVPIRDCTEGQRYKKLRPRDQEQSLQICHEHITAPPPLKQSKKWLFSTILERICVADKYFVRNRKDQVIQNDKHEVFRPRPANFQWNHVAPMHGFSDWKLCSMLEKGVISSSHCIWYGYTLDEWMAEANGVEKEMWERFLEMHEMS